MPIKTDSELTSQTNIIKNETLPLANTADRVGTMLSDIVENKINKSKFPFKSYSILFSQEGTNTPTITQLINDLGGIPVITRLSAGNYSFTLNGAFPENKTVLNNLSIDSPTGFDAIPVISFGNFEGSIIGYYTVTRSGTMGDEISLRSYNSAGSEDISVIVDGTINIYLEIKVFN